MVTLAKIQTAHSKVKSGADFPSYIQEIKQLGVSYYETFVRDGHTEFLTAEGHKLSSLPKYEPLIIKDERNDERFKQDLKANQLGKSDYLTFCRMSAKFGIEKWAVDTAKMTCTYFSQSGDEVLIEIIPG